MSFQPLRIVHYAPEIRLELGGVVRAVLDGCAVMASLGHDVSIATFDSPDLPRDWDGREGRPRAVLVTPTPRRNWLASAKTAAEWRQLLLQRPCVAHLHTPWTASNIQMSRIARQANVPYVVSIHGMLSDWAMQQRGLKKRLYLALGGRRFIESADAVHYTAEAEREQSEKWVPRGKSRVISCLLDLSPFHALPGPEIARSLYPPLRKGQPVMLFLSRLHEKKGVHFLIDAAGLLKRAGVPFQLVIAGSGSPDYERQLRRQVATQHLEDCVHFLGFVSGIEKISLYQAADLFVLPTQQENFGIALVESLAAGTPVVTTRGTDIWRELVEAGATIVDPAPALLAEALAKLIGQIDSLPALGERGRAWALEHMNLHKRAAEYEEMYRELMRRHASS